MNCIDLIVLIIKGNISVGIIVENISEDLDFVISLPLC